jgi:hypothetical protein
MCGFLSDGLVVMCLPYSTYAQTHVWPFGFFFKKNIHVNVGADLITTINQSILGPHPTKYFWKDKEEKKDRYHFSNKNTIAPPPRLRQQVRFCINPIIVEKVSMNGWVIT